MVLGQDFCICKTRKVARERKRVTNSRIAQSFKSDKKLIWKTTYSCAKIKSRSSPAQIPKRPNHRWIIISPLNVGDRGVTRIKWRRSLDTEESGASREKKNTCCYDLTQQNQIMREIRRENQNPPFLLRSRKARFWGAIVWANFALCSKCGQGRARPNIQSEGKRVSEDVHPRNGQNCHPRRGGALWWGIGPCPRTKVTSGILSEVSGELVNHSEQRLGQIL